MSANRAVSADVYPDDLSREEAQILNSAKIARFDGSDLMPDAMTNAFYQAVLQYVQNPNSLDSILSNLDQVRQDAYRNF